MIIRALKYLNKMPFPVTARWYSSKVKVNNLGGSKEAWEQVFTENPSYIFPESREEWLKEITVFESKSDGQDPDFPNRIQDIVKILKDNNIQCLFSVGSGRASVEYAIKKQLPHLRVIVTDFIPSVVERLKKNFSEAEARPFNALNFNDWKEIAEIPSMMVIYLRLEREFSDEEWRSIFGFMHKAGIEKSIIAIAPFLTFWAYVQSFARNTIKRIKGNPPMFVGYIRNPAGFERLFKGLYTGSQINLGKHVVYGGFLLSINKAEK